MLKAKEGFKLRKVSDQYCIVAVGKASKEFKGVISLNGTGAFMFEKLIQGTTKEDLIKAILDEYDVSEDVVTKDVENTIRLLKDNHIIEDE